MELPTSIVERNKMRIQANSKQSDITQLNIKGESFYRISNVEELRPFFMSIVSDSNHWMFISSNGGLSAGRQNANHALFPYYTDDKITELAEITGSKSIFVIDNPDGQSPLWEPFSIRQEGLYKVSRNLYKNIYGNKVMFEEVNHDLDLTFRYQWNSSESFGFVKKSELINNGELDLKISLLDGIQNILPSGVGSDLQNGTSNLVDAYKRSELIKETGVGIFALSALIVDKAEPSESLKATVAWSLGLSNPTHLLSSLQLKQFRRNHSIEEELDVKAEKGAYFISKTIDLASKAKKDWLIAADVDQNHAAIVDLSEKIKNANNIEEELNQNIESGTQQLIDLVGSADGLQSTADQYRDVRHFSNTLFNIMRGGIFNDNYQIEKWDFKKYLAGANQSVFNKNTEFVNQLPDQFSLFQLREFSDSVEDADLRRLSLEYLPLCFSRRHGDPSRPWNKFSINTRSEIDGSKILDYEGNWRDIFQNWEALVHAYPAFIESMVCKFLNASTFEGYNPYRVTKSGFDWETIEPDNPWSYIGYWGDHQIIYLLKFLEFFDAYSSTGLQDYFDQDIFVYANVPYKIKSFDAILSNPKDTIEFDEKLDIEIRKDKLTIGADGALLKNKVGEIHRVSFIEKILASLLSKLSNFIPEGGIWMNTQRPEWNDANNALVGNGVSMVTLYYTRRFLVFFSRILAASEKESVAISEELIAFYEKIQSVLFSNKDLLNGAINDTTRNLIVTELGEAGSEFRSGVYTAASFSGQKKQLSLKALREFVDLSIQYTEHTIQANQRTDELYHAYNLMSVSNEKEISIARLNEMLEGQVAVLSSGYLSAEAALKVLNGLKQSKLFRKDQYSYLLYPNKDLPGFMQKNKIPAKAIADSKLLSLLLENKALEILEKDIKNEYHFNGNFKNANDLKAALDNLSPAVYGDLLAEEREQLLQVFEEVFNHKEFTGRSGTFYGYEGLGSIYWHMVSKLQLAVQECCLKAIENQEKEEIIGGLLEHYYEINEGIGVHKPPSLYGAFPTDPYSHTPGGKGAQQPGMTGQVKEDLLCRYGELGVFIQGEKLLFNPCMLRKNEFLGAPQVFKYSNVNGVSKEIQLEENSLCFTFCQVPVIYKIGEKNQVTVVSSLAKKSAFDSLSLNPAFSQQIFERSGTVDRIEVELKQELLK